MAAVQAALGAEHAALWVYGLVSAFLPDSFNAPVAEGTTAHRARRDATERLLADAGETPRPGRAGLRAAAAGDRPEVGARGAGGRGVGHRRSAWRAVLERTDDQNLRRAALEALTTAAVRATRWRRAAGQNPGRAGVPGPAGRSSVSSGRVRGDSPPRRIASSQTSSSSSSVPPSAPFGS